MNKNKGFKFHNIGHMTHDYNLALVPKQYKTITTKHERKVTQVCRRTQIGLENALNTQGINPCFSSNKYIFDIYIPCFDGEIRTKTRQCILLGEYCDS